MAWQDFPVQNGTDYEKDQATHSMRIKTKETARLFKAAFEKWNEKDPFRESAVIAYYAIFALPGLLVLVVALGGYFFGSDAVIGQLHGQISGAMGNDTADQVQEMMKKASGSTHSISVSYTHLDVYKRQVLSESNVEAKLHPDLCFRN